MVLIILIFLFSCQPSNISPHTKRGQSKIQIKKVQTPYYVQHMTVDGSVPLIVKWEGPANKLIIQVEYIIRPTSPSIRFPIYNQNLVGNRRPFSNGELFSLFLLFIIISISLICSIFIASFTGKELDTIPIWLVK